MTAASFGSRLAQKMMSQQLSGIGSKGVSVAQKIGAGAAEVAGKKVPRMAGSRLASRILEEAVATGAVMGGAALLGAAADALYQPKTAPSASSQFSLPIQQQYEAASALEQQKFDHEMAIIRARESARAHRTSGGNLVSMDPMSLYNQLASDMSRVPQY